MTGVQHALHVAVVGPADADPDLCALAADVGHLLARAGATVVTGGLGGVMAAASRAAYDAGGQTVGLLPGHDRADANPWVTTIVPTGLGQARNYLVALASDGLIAVGGSWGTLSEVAHARRLDRPVAVLRGWTVLDRDGRPAPGLTVADDPAAAVAALLGSLGRDVNHS